MGFPMGFPMAFSARSRVFAAAGSGVGIQIVAFSAVFKKRKQPCAFKGPQGAAGDFWSKFDRWIQSGGSKHSHRYP